MPFAIIRFIDGSSRRVTTKSKALPIYEVWKGRAVPSAAQAAFMAQVKSVHMPNSWLPKDEQTEIPVDDGIKVNVPKLDYGKPKKARKPAGSDKPDWDGIYR